MKILATCVCVFVYIYIYRSVDMCVYAYVTYVHVYTHVFVCMHVHLYVCMYVCIRISAVRRRKVVKPGQCPVGAACENPAFGVGVGFGFDLVSVAFSTQWSDLCDCLGCLRALLRGPWVPNMAPMELVAVHGSNKQPKCTLEADPLGRKVRATMEQRLYLSVWLRQSICVRMSFVVSATDDGTMPRPFKSCMRVGSCYGIKIGWQCFGTSAG